MRFNIHKRITLLICLGICTTASLFAMKEEESSEKENFIVFPPEIFENIRRYSEKKTRHQLETTGKFLYLLGQKEREADIVYKAKVEALISLYQNDVKRKSKTTFESIRQDFIVLYKQSYAYYLFYFGSWNQFLQVKNKFILPNWKLHYSKKFSKNFPECQSIAIVIKREKEKTVVQTMVFCPTMFSIQNFTKLLQQSITQPSIQKIVLSNQTLFAKENIEDIIKTINQYGFKGIITLNINNLTVIAACCMGKMILTKDQFQSFLKSNDLYAIIPYGNYNNPLILLCQTEILLPQEFVELLLEYGADPNMHNSEGLVPLHLLCSRRTIAQNEKEIINHKNIITILLQKGANPNTQDQHQWTPLHFLCVKAMPSFNLIQLLLQYGANPNLQDKLLSSPLHHICSNENPSIELIRLLLQYDANPYLKDKFGNTPFDLIQDETVKQQALDFYESLQHEKTSI